VSTIAKVKKLPRAPSALEERFWYYCVLYNVPRPAREYRFHPERKWRIDFAWPACKIAVECEGGIWAGGRHTRGAGFEADCYKYNELAASGWRVFRFTKRMIDSGEAIKMVLAALP
jgi:very-short-patch-repair endonuclease